MLLKHAGLPWLSLWQELGRAEGRAWYPSRCPTEQAGHCRLRLTAECTNTDKKSYCRVFKRVYAVLKGSLFHWFVYLWGGFCGNTSSRLHCRSSSGGNKVSRQGIQSLTIAHGGLQEEERRDMMRSLNYIHGTLFQGEICGRYLPHQCK